MTDAAAEPLTLHTHGGGLFSLPLPTEWLVRENELGAALICAEPAEPGHPAPSIVVTVQPLEGSELEAWTTASREALLVELTQARLIDAEPADLGQLPGRRTLVHHLDDHLGGLVLEQWLASHHGWGLVLSCTCGALEYDALADMFATVADGFATHEGSAGSR